MVQATRANAPSDLQLSTALSAALAMCDRGPRATRVVDRRPLAIAGTAPAEVLTCHLDHGEVVLLFSKYASRARERAAGTRGGVGYEAAVYRDLLAPRHAGTPRFYGTYSDPVAAIDYLFLAYLDGAAHLNQAPGTAMLEHAARWLGHFHADWTASALPAPPYLTRYDAYAYAGWARRTARFSAPLLTQFPWLDALCDRYSRVAPSLLLDEPVVIHGEFYPLNVLVHHGTIYPVDWESAALAAGEIDLASLTEGWSAASSARCEASYARARWPGGPPPDFQRRLDAARLYLQFRWLGDRQEWTLHERLRPRFAAARQLGERLGLL